MKTCYFLTSVCCTVTLVVCDLFEELSRISDLSEFQRLINLYPVPSSYLKDIRSSVSVFAEVDDVFIRYPSQRSLSQHELLARFADVAIPEIVKGSKWLNSLLVRNSVKSGKIYVTQFEHNPGNFSYFANNGRLCNQALNSWALMSQSSYLFKVCSWFGHQAFRGTALDFLRSTELGLFSGSRYSNQDLTSLRDLLLRLTDVFTVVFGASNWNGYHTFFLPNNAAFEQFSDLNSVREVLLAHVTSKNWVLFTESWLYDYGIHYVPSVRLGSFFVEENPRMSLSIRNLTDPKTGRWQTYAVSTVWERHSVFRKGSVWSKIVVPNIPLDNGVAHIVDTVLGSVSRTIEQIVESDEKTKHLTNKLLTFSPHTRQHLSSTGGLVTFFAPTNEAFERIPQHVERRVLGSQYWLEQVMKLHIVPSKDLTTDQINNFTVVNTVDNNRQLSFIKGEWPKNNITYYVMGGGVKASIYQEDVSAVNGIVHFIDRVLGIPYDTLATVILNDTELRITALALRETQLMGTLNQGLLEQHRHNVTFFVPTDEAWNKVSIGLRQRFFDGSRVKALEFVLKRHIIGGHALMLTDLREKRYVVMNDQLIYVRRRERHFELYWPYANKVARLVDGGEVAGVNGFLHKIDNVLVLEEDLEAAGVYTGGHYLLVLFGVFLYLRVTVLKRVVLLCTSF